MLNFQELQPIVSDKYSFVGIQNKNHQLQLYLPKGFDAKNFNTYNSKRDIYFLLYKILHHYKQICEEKGNLEKQLVKDRDGVIQSNDSVHKVVIPESDGEVLLYSKLDAIGKILDAYDEPKIMSLAHRLGESEEIDYSQIHQYLDRAKYLPNGAAYIDTMDMPRLQVKYQSTDIVGMYCYIFFEVKQQLGEEIISEIQVLAEGFAHRYLDAENSLFNEESCIKTVDVLKDILETIEHQTPIKDADYWDFHNAIELFLYGELSQQEEGEIWGINNFCYVWESMCLTYLAKSIDSSRLLYVDNNNLSSDVIALAESKPKQLNVKYAFEINGSPLRPDAVILDNPYNFQHIGETNSCHLRMDLNRGKFWTHWDDYGYRTAFYCEIPSLSKEIWLRIAYENQYEGYHTFYELKKEYVSQNDYLSINSQLPNNYYSFWTISLEELNHNILLLMRILNHVFYVALKNNVYTADAFYNFLSTNFNLNKKRKNVFVQSLFQDVRIYFPTAITRAKLSYDEREIIFMYERFIKRVTCLNIIDIKYKPVSNYFDENKREEIKTRDIRKQFVYEHLLQRHIQNNPKFNQLEIKSSFWLPRDDELQHMSKVEPEYLNGYIELNKVKFNIIANSYLE